MKDFNPLLPLLMLLLGNWAVWAENDTPQGDSPNSPAQTPIAVSGPTQAPLQAIVQEAADKVADKQAPAAKSNQTGRRQLDGWNEVLGRDASAETLTARDKKMAVESFSKPYQAGHWDTVIQNVRKQLSRRNAEEIEAISNYLQAGQQPSLAEMLTRSRLRLLRSGAKQVPTANTVEAMLMRRQLATMLDRKLDDFREIPLMADPLEDPRDFLAYRDLIWDRHVQANEFNNATQLAKQGRALRPAPAKRSKLGEQTIREELAKQDFGQYLDQIKHLRKDMDQRALEVRVDRVNYAVEILEDSAAGVKDRFFAAYIIGVDSESLVAEIKQGRGKFDRPALQDPELVVDLQGKLKRGADSAGSLIEKSRLLFAGLHWWRRGRYGAGPDAFGLLKSPTAIRDARMRFGLMMPKVTPEPTDPGEFNNRPVPHYQRRHLFVWAYEDRKFGTQGSSQKQRSTSSQTNSRSPLTNKHFDGTIDGSFY